MATAKLSEKLELYGSKVPGISAYANGWLPLILIVSLWGFVSTDLYAIPLYEVALRAGSLSLAVCAIITIRTPDKMALNWNLIYLVYLILYEVYQVSSVFMLVTSATNSAATQINSAVGSNSIIASGVAMGQGIVMGGAVLGVFISLVPVLFFCIFYIGVFVGHRKFFLASVKELQEI